MIIFFISLLLLCDNDWPQWGGPNRNFSSPLSMPDIDQERPLEPVWQADVGAGFAGVVVAKGKVIVHQRNDQVESVVAYESCSGNELWRYSYDAPPVDSMIPRYGFGPNSTPCVSGNSVCCVGGTGILSVLNLETGELIWSRGLWSEIGGTVLERGYASSPIVCGSNVIVQVGGKRKGIVAFDLANGEETWRATDCEACYTSPFLFEIGGTRQLVFLMEQSLVALDPTTGELLWKYDYPVFKTVHVTSPIQVDEDRIFILSSNKATMLKVAKRKNESERDRQWEVVRIWESTAMTPQVGNIIKIDSQLIGPHTTMNALLTGIELASGKRLWRSRITNAGFLYRFNNGFVSIGDNGRIRFNQLQDGKPKTLLTLNEQLSGKVWNTAAFVDDMIFVRDTKSIHAFRIVKQPD